jgi:predicted TIM-barrel fold metal-dependent hydrolase
MRYAYANAGGLTRNDALPEGGGYPGSDYQLLRTQLLDKYSIEIAILVPIFQPTDPHAQPEFASALASAYNDWIVDQWLSKDDRLRASILVNSDDVDSARREIRRFANNQQFVQVLVSPPIEGGLGVTRLHPLYEAAEENNLVIAIHGTANWSTAIGFPGRLIEWRSLALPQVCMSQIASLVFNGVFEKFPKLRCSVLEGGWTWLPHLMWRLDQNYRSFRAEVPWLKRLPSDVIRQHVRFSTQPMEDLTREDFLKVIDLLRTDELLMFSTDYPHLDFDSPLQSLPPMPPEILGKIMSSNARTWYQL